jgi:hypothetical protein
MRFSCLTGTTLCSYTAYWVYIVPITTLSPLSGYTFGGAGEPCQAGSRPYFRPSNKVTRGQASKIVASTFYPACVTPARP